MDAREHLAWAKERAFAELAGPDPSRALASFYNDLMNHPDLASHPGIMLGMMLATTGHLSDPEKIRNHIDGFN